MATCAPPRASCKAVARPIPRDAPVTIATRLSKSPGIFRTLFRIIMHGRRIELKPPRRSRLPGLSGEDLCRLQMQVASGRRDLTVRPSEPGACAGDDHGA